MRIGKTVKGAILTFMSVILPAGALIAISVTPARYEARLKPGAAMKGEYTVKNTVDKQVSVSVTKRDWYISEGNQEFSCDKWLKISPESFILGPGESKNIKFNVRVPKKAKGALFAMISMNSKEEDTEMLSLLISVPVFVIVKGTEQESGELKDLKVRRDQDNLQVSVEVYNPGNVHLRPSGECVLSAPGKDNIVIPIKEGRPVYPGKSRTSIGYVPAASVANGEYSATITIHSGDLLFGTTASVKVDKEEGLYIVE